MNRSQGFTLVEVAVVIVIIGLLLGGILKGQEIITQAKIKNLEGKIDSLARAIHIYQERYQSLPGDDSKATRFGATVVVCSGQACGNGKIEGDFDSNVDDIESRLGWLHLRSANLIFKTDDSNQQQQPSHVFGGLVGFSNTKNNNQFIGLHIGLTHIPNEIAVILESRLDDMDTKKGYIQSDQADYGTENQTTINESQYHKLYFYL